MPFDNLRRYDYQARYALVLALFAIAPFVAATGLLIRNYNAVLGRVVYGSGGRFIFAFAVAVLLSLAPAVCAFVLGWNSAGQRRNDKSARSWLGFFVGGLIATLNIILLIAFYMLRLET